MLYNKKQFLVKDDVPMKYVQGANIPGILRLLVIVTINEENENRDPMCHLIFLTFIQLIYTFHGCDK